LKWTNGARAAAPDGYGARTPLYGAGSDEAKWLGWLSIVEEQQRTIRHLTDIAADARGADSAHAVLLGMGGSSLGAEVFANTFGAQPDCPKLLVLDSTDPCEIKAIENAIDLARTLFIVSSKSGSTLEPNILKDYFFARVEAALGSGKAGPAFYRHHRSRLQT
jgi:transaldolase/glucose-6-phosphate isomerase